MIRRLARCLCALLLVLPCAGLSQDRAHSKIESPFAEYVEPEFPYFGQVVDARGFGGEDTERNLTPRGIVLDLGEGLHACFDPDLLRVSLVWRETAEGEYLAMNGMAPGSYRVPGLKSAEGQEKLPRPMGEALCATGIYPGWFAGEVRFEDPREPSADPVEVGLGPIPEAMGRWEGIFLSQAGAVLRYRVGGTRVLERMRGARPGKSPVVVRGLRIAAHESELVVVLDQIGEVEAQCASGTVERVDGRLVVRFAPATEEMDHAILILLAGPGDAAAMAAKLVKPGLEGIEEPAGARWAEDVVTEGKRSEGDGAFVIDEVALPVPNPWKRNVRLSGMDFFEDGRAAMATFDGDVWIVSGIDDALTEVRWRRFGSGLNEPMGLQIVEGEIYVFDRGGIVRLHDVNGDGEADFYENFSNVVAQTAETREFAMDLLKKPGGGFYIAKGGQIGSTTGKMNGRIVEIFEDGRSFEVIAHGLRQPYAGIDPETGVVTASDQQGHWVPATPVRWIEKGSYHGFIPTIVKDPVQTGEITEPPVWIPHIVNQSGASQVWLRDAKMGPLNDSLIHIGYNRPELFKVYLDEGGAARQGAVASAVAEFPCALLKGVVHPVDGQLYTCGFRIWGTALDPISGFFRVRSTGAPSRVPEDVRAGREGVLLRFSFEVDREIALNPASYQVERWNYRRTADYGSGHYRLDGEPGQETLPVASLYLSEDKRSVFLGIPDMRPVHSMRVTYRLAVPTEIPVVQNAYLTIHEVRDIDLAAAGFGDIEVDLSVSASAAAAAEAPDPSIELGAQFATVIGCVACHSANGSTLAAVPGQVVGPSWKGLWGSKRELSDGAIVKKVDEVYLRESILDPAAKVAKGFENMGVGMPSYLGVLQDWQINSVILYIQSLK